VLIVALVLAVISLAALVTAVVTSNEMIAWACIGFSALGVLLLIVDAIRDRNRRAVAPAASDRPLTPADAALAAETTEVMAPVADDGFVDEESIEDEYPDEVSLVEEDYPDEVVYDDPEHDEPSDDEPDYPIAAEEAALHTISADDLDVESAADDVESAVAPAIERDESGSYTVVYAGESPDEVAEQPSYMVADEPSYMVAESPTVSHAETSGDDSIVIIYSSQPETGSSEDSEESGGER
jgi:hypothetical protein